MNRYTIKMQTVHTRSNNLLYRIYRVLQGICVLMVITILTVSLYTFAAEEEPLPPTLEQNTSYFTGLGKIRARSSEPDAALLIISPVFPYNAADKAFAEELSAETAQFRDITRALILEYSTEQLLQSGENLIKDELLRRFNTRLRLGHIEQLFFTEYMIIEGTTDSVTNS